MKHYTTVQQSRKLVRLGLDPNTADMVYLKYASSDNLTPRFEGATPMVLRDLSVSEIDYETLPCWSLGALIELSKVCTRLECYLRANKRWNIFATCEEKISISFYLTDPKGYDSQLKAYYDLVVWLLENNYIEKQSYV